MEVKNLAAVLLFSLLTAGLSLFFQKCQEKGMIFRKYRNLIKYWLWLPKKKRYNYTKFFAGVWTTQQRIKLKDNNFEWLYKILGGCVYCNGTWILITAFLISYGFDIKLLLLAMGGNYLWIELGLKIKA